MSEKVKRGLGLLVLAAAAMVLGLAVTSNDGPAVVSGLAGLLVLALGAPGLVLLAWGLLRD